MCLTDRQEIAFRHDIEDRSHRIGSSDSTNLDKRRRSRHIANPRCAETVVMETADGKPKEMTISLARIAINTRSLEDASAIEK